MNLVRKDWFVEASDGVAVVQPASHVVTPFEITIEGIKMGSLLKEPHQRNSGSVQDQDVDRHRVDLP